MGPFNGAKLVAKAWVDPDFKARLLEDTPAAIAEMNFPRLLALETLKSMLLSNLMAIGQLRQFSRSSY
jgi:hypothetical protein